MIEAKGADVSPGVQEGLKERMLEVFVAISKCYILYFLYNWVDSAKSNRRQEEKGYQALLSLAIHKLNIFSY